MSVLKSKALALVRKSRKGEKWAWKIKICAPYVRKSWILYKSASYVALHKYEQNFLFSLLLLPHPKKE